jgi:hypothetical protein
VPSSKNGTDHQVVLRTRSDVPGHDVWVTCQCQVAPVGLDQGRTDRAPGYQTWYGKSETHADTLRLFNQGEHNGDWDVRRDGLGTSGRSRKW